MTDTAGKRIRVLREALGLTQTDFGDLIDVVQGTISDWELNKGPPDPGRVRLAADLVKDGRRVYRWLMQGGSRTPALLPISSREPDEIEKAYSRAVVEIGRASTSEGMVPLPLVTTWLSRLRDLAVDSEEATPPTEEGAGLSVGG